MSVRYLFNLKKDPHFCEFRLNSVKSYSHPHLIGCSITRFLISNIASSVTVNIFRLNLLFTNLFIDTGALKLNEFYDNIALKTCLLKFLHGADLSSIFLFENQVDSFVHFKFLHQHLLDLLYRLDGFNLDRQGKALIAPSFYQSSWTYERESHRTSTLRFRENGINTHLHKPWR